MDEPEAIMTAHKRIGRNSRTTAVMVYAALLQLVDQDGRARSVPIADIALLSLVSERTVHRTLPALELLRVIEIDRDPKNQNPSKFRHIYGGTR